MLRTAIKTACVYLLAVASAHASLGMFGGDHTLLPDHPNQPISITLTGMLGDPQIVGANVVAQIPTGPVFQEVVADPLGAADFGNGTIWNVPHDVSGFAPISGATEFVTASVTLDGVSVDPNGVLVKLLVDTTGIHSGVFDLLLRSDNPSFTSNVILAGGAELEPTITNGTITVNAVPEPSSFSLLGVIFLAGVAATKVFRRFRSVASAPDVSQ